MGTLVRVTVYVRDEQAATRAFRAAFDRIQALDRILSDYRTDSELNEITRIAVGRPVPVSSDLFTVLQKSQELADVTGGAFDITQGPVIRLWRDARKSGRVPEPAVLDQAAARSGYRKLHLDAKHRTVRLESAGMTLDVGAIGKGYAASEATAVLSSLGIGSALVAISGDLAFSEAPPGQHGWRIRVHSEDPAAAKIPDVLELTNAAVSTAGSGEQHVDIGGRRYSHIIDPSSRLGLEEDITVTVIAPHGIDADGLDTAVSVIGARRGLALIDARTDTAALITLRTPAGTQWLPSSRFLKLMKAQNAATSASRTARGEPGEMFVLLSAFR
jgi:FAD:protein FMN transferase